MRKVIEDGKTMYEVHGTLMTEAEFERAFLYVKSNQPGASLVGWKPIVSEALAVHPDLIPEAIESARKHGVPTDFAAEGQPIFTSRTHRAKYLRSYGFFDKSAGYGDPADGSYKG